MIVPSQQLAIHGSHPVPRRDVALAEVDAGGRIRQASEDTLRGVLP